MKMKSLFIAVSSILLFSACGKAPVSILVDAEFKPYYQRFIEHSKIYGTDLSNESIEIKFVPQLTDDRPDTTRLGICYFISATVEINQSAWTNLSVERREALIAHELGHCLLHRRHDDSVDPETRKKLSIMHAYLLTPREFVNKYLYYMSELFIRPVNKDLTAFRAESPSSYVSPLTNFASGVEELNLRSEYSPQTESSDDEVEFVVD